MANKNTRTEEAGAATTAAAAPATIPATSQINVNGVVFTTSNPYSAGHTLTLNEAIALNQTRCENLRNNFSGKVTAAKKAQLAVERFGAGATAEQLKTLTDAEIKAVQLAQTAIDALLAEFSTYSASYEFNGKRQPSVPVDPVGKLAYKIAKEIVTAALKKQNVDVKSVSDEKMDQLVLGTIEKHPGRTTEEAKRRIAAQQQASDIVLDLEPTAAAA